ncbi:Mitochondrial substrate/solute carrier [Trinorchestia longiramus]|nr:Mitochondrial substrate/solute carrier [Trinorchestia longiramus]
MIEWAAGLAGGCAGVAVGHPFDTVKVKLQTQDFRNPRYHGTWDCFSQTVKKEGMRGLYRGMTSPMVGVGAVNAVIFGVHGAVSKRFDDPNSLKTHFTAGVCAGFVQSFIASPVELVKTRLQIQADAVGTSSNVTVKHSGPLQCLQHIFQTEGMRGVFRGQLITIMREIPGFGTYFLSYEWMARKLSGNDSGSGAGPLSVLIAGGVAGAASWLANYPIDVIKSRIQSDGAFGPSRYNGIVDCFKTSVREEGWSVLTRGLNSTLLRAFPTNAATFFVVTSVLKHFGPQTSQDVSDSHLAIIEIYRTAEIIMEAAGAAHEVYDFHRRTLKKLKENHLANFLPIVLAASDSPDLDKQPLSCVLDPTSLLNTSNKDRSCWMRRRGIVTQTPSPSESVVVNHHLLSLVL